MMMSWRRERSVRQGPQLQYRRFLSREKRALTWTPRNNRKNLKRKGRKNEKSVKRRGRKKRKEEKLWFSSHKRERLKQEEERAKEKEAEKAREKE